MVLRNIGPAHLALAPPQTPQSCEAFVFRVGRRPVPYALCPAMLPLRPKSVELREDDLVRPVRCDSMQVGVLGHCAAELDGMSRIITLPRLGSRVRFASPAPIFSHEYNSLDRAARAPERFLLGVATG